LGTNNYYLMYSSHVMVDDVLTAAAANGFNVMLLWDLGVQLYANPYFATEDTV